jgi:hypothetical protein
VKSCAKLSLFAVLAILTTGGAWGPGFNPAQLWTELTAISEALKAAHSAIQHADDATKDRLADADTRIARNIHDVDILLKEHEDKTKTIANDLLDKTIRAGSDALYTVSLEVQDAGLDYDLKINNAILNAARVLSGFKTIRPFVAMIYPLNLVPGVGEDYHIEVLGLFRPDWGDHAFTLPDGTVSKASIGADNRLAVTLKKELAQHYAGKRITVKFRYPVKRNTIFANEFDEREIWLQVLPTTVLTYAASPKALPDTVFDYPQVRVSANENADPGVVIDRDVPWGFNDLTGRYDFRNTYDRSSSSIDSAVIKPGDVVGNNPTSDNSAKLTESAGQRINLHLHVHGKASTFFEGGKGANTSATVTVTLKLARKNAAVAWHFKGGEKDDGSLGWGQDKELFPDKEKPLQSLILSLRDLSFDPPQERTLSLGESYQSKFVIVTTKPDRISMAVRTFQRH